jgi:hypothetical protein
VRSISSSSYEGRIRDRKLFFINRMRLIGRNQPGTRIYFAFRGEMKEETEKEHTIPSRFD